MLGEQRLLTGEQMLAPEHARAVPSIKGRSRVILSFLVVLGACSCLHSPACLQCSRSRIDGLVLSGMLVHAWNAVGFFISPPASVQVGTDGRVLSSNAPCPLSPPFTAACQSSHVPPGARTLKLATVLGSSALSFVLCVLGS